MSATRASPASISARPSATVRVSVPELQPGERRTFSIPRGTIQRCVTTGELPGCHECAGQTPYQDPTFTITVDPTNRIAEADEDNNALRY
jgi:subtilase family serine protease